MNNIFYMEKNELMRFVEDKFIEMVDNGSISMRDKEVKDMMNNRVARDEFLKIAMSDGYLILMTDNYLRGIECEQAGGLMYLEEMDCDDESLSALPEKDFNWLSTIIKTCFINFLFSNDYYPEELFMTEGYSYKNSVLYVDDFLVSLLEKDSVTDSEKEEVERIFELWFEAFDGYDISTFEKYIIEVFDDCWDIQLAYLKSLMSPFIENGYIEDDIEGERFIVTEKTFKCIDWMKSLKGL